MIPSCPPRGGRKLSEMCPRRHELAPVLQTLLDHPCWDRAQKVLALDGVKRAVCDCNELCGWGIEALVRTSK